MRETDWLDGWDYKMIKSSSGLIEKHCVFTTLHHGKFETVWHVTQYDKINYKIEFLRLTPTENVVKINIQLERINGQQTKAFIDYQYTTLCEEQNRFKETDLEKVFLESMEWKRSINPYSETGIKLKK